MIKNSGEIEVESFSGEKIILVSTKQILPIIILIQMMLIINRCMYHRRIMLYESMFLA